MSRWNGCNSIIIIIYFNFEQLCSSALYTNTKYKHARHANCKASVFRCFMQRVSAKAAFSFSWSIKTFNFDNFALICKIYPNKRLDFFHPSYTSAHLYASSLPWDVWPLNPLPPPPQLRLSRGCRAVWVSRRRFPTWCMYPRGWYLRREL